LGSHLRSVYVRYIVQMHGLEKASYLRPATRTRKTTPLITLIEMIDGDQPDSY
jgi:hypothetical protein